MYTYIYIYYIYVYIYICIYIYIYTHIHTYMLNWRETDICIVQYLGMVVPSVSAVFLVLVLVPSIIITILIFHHNTTCISIIIIVVISIIVSITPSVWAVFRFAVLPFRHDACPCPFPVFSQRSVTRR